MLFRAFIAIALVCAIPSAYSYSAGAPEAACRDMIPQHHVDPQNSKAPYSLDLSSRQLKSDGSDPVSVVLKGKSSGDTIKGFLLQARVDGSDDAVGTWTIKSTKYAQLLNCPGGQSNAVTHKKIFSTSLKNIEASWTPTADLKGKTVKFYGTVALNGGVFWVQQFQEPVTVA